ITLYLFSYFIVLFFIMISRPPISTLFPYTTLFRSHWSVFCRYHRTPGCCSLYSFPRTVTVAVFGCLAMLCYTSLIHVKDSLIVCNEELPLGVLDLIATTERRRIHDFALRTADAHVAIKVSVLNTNRDGFGPRHILLLEQLMKVAVARAVMF